ncbi:ATP-binding protein [Caldilinea sp.]|uniref:sensor histidine kinase n=1 Tax=Caldilinea sp. TaxID=2293560 RepID=UPI002D06D878|nr:ATP-binding protein [Caldilinea sp.]HRA67228.1 ATP-binding protein [Caldilinea sp.]
MLRHVKRIRVRFALWTAGLILLLLVAFGAFVYYRVAQGLTDAVDEALNLSAAQTLTALNVENGVITLAEDFPEVDNQSIEMMERGLTVRVLDASGRTVQAFGPQRSLPPPSNSLQSSSATIPIIQTFAAGTAPVRVLSTPVLEDGASVGMVQTAATLATVEGTLARLLTALFVGGAALTVIAALGGYALAARALQPIDQMTRTARRISAEDLSARLDLPATDDEVGRLAVTFDEMLGRLDESFRRERQFTANASHELRTPLAAMQVILGVVRAQPRTTPEYEAAIDDLADEAERLQTLVDRLLYLARRDAQRSDLRKPVDLTFLLADIVDSLEPLAAQKGIALTLRTPARLMIQGDSDSLARLFVNLLDNAIKYTQQGGVSVSAAAHTDGATVTVSDSGVGIAAEHLPHLFDRFYRVDAARTTRGAGLGLAIAHDIAQAHGGDIAVSSQIGQGATFTVHLLS